MKRKKDGVEGIDKDGEGETEGENITKEGRVERERKQENGKCK